DWDRNAADHVVVVQQRRPDEARFGREILDDDRSARGECEAGLGVARGLYIGAAHQARIPADARPQQKLGIDGHEFEDLDQLQIEDAGDRRGRFVEEFLEVFFDQRALPEPGDRFLLACPCAQLAVHGETVGDVPADADHPYRLPVLDDDRAYRLNPALAAVWLRWQTIERAIGLVAAQRLGDGGDRAGPIVGMNVLLEIRECAVEGARRHLMDGLEVGRPGYAVVRQLPAPDADVGGFEAGRDQFGM